MNRHDDAYQQDDAHDHDMPAGLEGRLRDALSRTAAAVPVGTGASAGSGSVVTLRPR